jgi:energy-coupling factor transporter ATP-binding protein EcfA2
MLVEFRVGNYRSFREPQALSLVASSDRSHAEHLIPCGKESLLKAAVLYGANASGKSNFLRALTFVAWFVRNSATKMTVGDPIEVTPFRLDAGSRAQPSRFETTLVIDDVRYRYGFSATRERVYDEWLTAYPERRAQRWFERRYDPETKQVRWSFKGELKRSGDLLRERTRDNGLVLSRGAELNVQQLLPAFKAFADRFWTCDLSDEDTLFKILQKTAARLEGDPDLRRDAMRLLRDADVGIEDVYLQKEDAPPPTWHAEVRRIVPDDLKHLVDDGPLYRVQAVHRATGTNERVLFDFEAAESKGTRRLLALAGLWLDGLCEGSLLILDELDCSMHPLLVRGLLELFHSPNRNTRGAQLIFATHDNTLMNQSLFRRDQIWLVEKDADQASRLFSLYDFAEKPRKGEAIHRGYLAGRYGGVPTLGATFEAVEFR